MIDNVVTQPWLRQPWLERTTVVAQQQQQPAPAAGLGCCGRVLFALVAGGGVR